MVEVPEVLSFLAGEWDLERAIDDGANARSGTFRGRARFSPHRSDRLLCRLAYEEEGELSFGGHRGPAWRRLEYSSRADGTALVSFPDGRLFVDLDLRRGSWRAVHSCGADCYELITVVRSEELLEEAWVVTGPAKGWSASTLLRRRGRRRGAIVSES